MSTARISRLTVTSMVVIWFMILVSPSIGKAKMVTSPSSLTTAAARQGLDDADSDVAGTVTGLVGSSNAETSGCDWLMLLGLNSAHGSPTTCQYRSDGGCCWVRRS